MSLNGLRQSNAALAKMLVGRGIKVTQRGSQAYVLAEPDTNEPVLINLPSLPDDAPDMLVHATQGFIDHEAGHVLFTDWAVCGEANRQGLSSSHNMVEDVFVETSMQGAFPGSAANLDRLHELFVKVITPTLLQDAGADEERALGILVVPAVRALAGQQQFVSFMEEGRHWERPSLIAFLNEFGELGRTRLPFLRSSAECLEIARALELALRAGRQAAGARSTKAGRGRTDATRSSGTESAGKGAGQGGGSDRDRRDAGECGAASVAGGGPEATLDGGGERAGESSTPPSRSRRSDATARGDGRIRSRDANDPFASTVARAISDGAREAAVQASYKVFTRDLDVIAPLNVLGRYDDAWLADLDGSVMRTVGALQRRLERVMAARAVVRPVLGCRSGRLHSGSLHKVALGDDRVFRRRHEAPAKNTAISLLIDNSGSMQGPKMQLAMTAGYALVQTAERSKIPSECLGFTTIYTEDFCPEDDLAAGRPDESEMWEYSRSEALHIPIFKAFDERFGQLVRRRFAFAAMGQSFCRSNADGESLEIAANRLLRRGEARRVMLVLSDGQPSAGRRKDLDAHLHATVEAVTKAGVELLGVGIDDDSVEKFYPRSFVLRDISDLPAMVMTELGRTLDVGKARRQAMPKARRESRRGK